MILVQGGANPYTYHWSPAVSTSSIDTQLSTGSYTVSVTDRVGCVGTVSFSIGSATSISVWAGPDTTLCAGSSITLHVADGYTYLWSNGGTDSAATYTAPAANPVKVRVTKGNCTLTDSVYIYTDSISAFSITASRDSICPTQPDTVVLYGSASGLRPLGYDWSTGHIDSPALHSFIQVYQSGTYTLTVHDGICSVSRTLSIVDGSCDTICQGVFRMPNAFTPNGDGVNEVFKAVYKCSVFDFSLRIYNRWGELVYQGNDVSTGWDGNYKGSTQPGETYMWYACASATKGGVVKCTSGTLEILR
jgi:gliding motility-associated-like protein